MSESGARHPCLWSMSGEELLLERLLELIEQPGDPEEVLRALRGARGGDGWSRLSRAGEGLGLRVEAGRGALEEALTGLHAQEPLLLQAPGQGWLVVVERRGGEVALEVPARGEPVWVRLGELSAWAGDPAAEGWRWLRVRAARPMAAMTAVDPRGEREALTPVRRLLALAQVERRDIGVVVVFAVGVGFLTLATPIAMQALVNTVSFGVLLQPLIVLSALLLGGLGFAAALRALEIWVVEILQRRLFLRLVGDVSWRLPRVQHRVFDQSHGPELVNRFFDIFTVKKVSAWILLEGLEITLTVLIGMLVLAFYHPILLAFDVILLLATALILGVLGRGGAKTAIKESKAKYAVAGWLEEMARHPFTFKAIGGPEFGFARADALARRYLNARHKHFKIVLRQIVGVLALQALATTALVAIGGWLVMERQLTLGQLVAAELIVSVVVASLLKLSRYLENVYDLIAAVDKVGQLVDLPLERDGGQWLASDCAARGAALRLRGVSFGFLPGRPLFEEVNVALSPGERVVLTGSSGAGKSALLDMIFGAREPWSGAVELDGEDLRELRLSSLRERVAIVRGPEVFEGTVLENLTMGRADLSVAQVERALEAVGLEDAVARLPEGMHTVLASGAPQLSTSQAIRLTIARALLARPSLLVVDDIFSRFSQEVRAQVLAALTAPEAPWTLLVVTHDPWIQGCCGRLLRLEGGQLIEEARPC